MKRTSPLPGAQIADRLAEDSAGCNDHGHHCGEHERIAHRPLQGFTDDDDGEKRGLRDQFAGDHRNRGAERTEPRDQQQCQHDEQHELRRLGPQQQRPAVAVIGIAHRQQRGRRDAGADQQRDRQGRIIGNGAMGPDREEIRPERQRARGGRGGEQHQHHRSPHIQPLQAVARADRVVVPELGGKRQRRLIAHLPQQIDDGARQAPLGDGDAVRHEEADQENGEIAQAQLDEVRHRERQGAQQIARVSSAGISRRGNARETEIAGARR